MEYEALEQFRKAMQDRGLCPPPDLIADGSFHRCGTVAKPNSKDGAYFLHDDKYPHGGFENHYDGEGWESWCIKGDFSSLSPAEKAKWKKQIDAVRAKREAQREAEYEAAAIKAQIYWGSISENGDSPYLTKKQVSAQGVRFDGENVVVPVRDAAGKIWSMQTIYPDGDKRFYSGGKIRGGFHRIGDFSDPKTVVICEGYATGVSINQATDLPVIATFNAGNLSPVAKTIRGQYSSASIIIAADNDAWKEKNVGKIKAEEAAHLCGGKIALPVFDAAFHEQKPTDFNDLHILEGLEKVRQQFEKVIQTAEPTHSAYRLITGDKHKADGVYYFGKDDKGEPIKPLWISAPLKITARTRDDQGAEWGYLLEWYDPDDRKHQWAMPQESLAGQGDEYRRELLSGGLDIAPGTKAKNHLTNYIQTARTEARALCTDKTGWREGVYVLPNQSLGQTDQQVIFQSITSVKHNFAAKGTLQQWREAIALLCKGNSLALFALSTAFASVLLELAGEESGGFHFRGESSTGKTTLLRIASSVWGGSDYLQRWRATSNGLEGLAQMHNDCLLVLDELAQVEPKEAGQNAYMLGNGSGKNRADRQGMARKSARWRLLYLSAGEIGLADHVRESGQTVKAGQEIRLIDIPADAGMGMGIFESLNGFDTPALLARHLNDAVQRYYGVAGTAFVESVIANREALANDLPKHRHKFLEETLPKDAAGQVERVISRFALVAVAGELATHFGLTSWQVGEAEAGVKVCCNAWLQARGGAGNMEVQSLLADIRAFLEKHEESRFSYLGKNDDSRPVHNRVGYIRDGEEGREFIVLPECFKRDLCKGHDAKMATRVLHEAEILIPDSSGSPQARVTLPGNKRQRCYIISAKNLWKDES